MRVPSLPMFRIIGLPGKLAKGPAVTKPNPFPKYLAVNRILLTGSGISKSREESQYGIVVPSACSILNKRNRRFSLKNDSKYKIDFCPIYGYSMVHFFYRTTQILLILKSDEDYTN
jgi:hypothetical protein